jgi:hypothetical protein
MLSKWDMCISRNTGIKMYSADNTSFRMLGMEFGILIATQIELNKLL